MKNIFQKYLPTISGAISKVTRLVQARFEAAYTNWGARRMLMTAYQDARFEVDWSATMEVCRKHIYFCENNPLVRRIEALKVQFGVGVDGLQVIPDPSDPKMDKTALEGWVAARQLRWDKFCIAPDLSNNLSMGQLTKLWEHQLFRVGNIIVIKTTDEKGQLAIQTVDRLRLRTPPQYMAEEGKTVCQGIRLKKISVKTRTVGGDGKIVTDIKQIVTGKPELYYIRDEFDENSFAEVPAENVIHKYHCDMPGQMVGIPEATVINLLHDFEDLHILEMGASKIAAKIPNVVKTATGEMSTRTARQVGIKIPNPAGATNTPTRTAPFDYDVTIGAETIAMMHGDDIKNFMINRPTVAQQDYWDFLLSQICVGYNVPKLLVLPYSLQGTVTRADLAVARDAFRGDFELVAAVLREVYEWWGDRDVRHNPANFKQAIPADYNACEIHPPDSPDVDIGYTSAGLATEMELGVTNIAQICGRRQIKWRSLIRQTAQIEKAIDEEAKAAGIDSSRISSKLFKTGRALAQEDSNIDGGDESAGKGSTGKTAEEAKQMEAETA